MGRQSRKAVLRSKPDFILGKLSDLKDVFQSSEGALPTPRAAPQQSKEDTDARASPMPSMRPPAPKSRIPQSARRSAGARTDRSHVRRR